MQTKTKTLTKHLDIDSLKYLVDNVQILKDRLATTMQEAVYLKGKFILVDKDVGSPQNDDKMNRKFEDFLK